MKFIRFEILIIILTVACSTLTLPIPSGTPSPSPAILVDTFFYGYAYLDTNHNGEIDTADTPLAGAIFSATDANGLSTQGITGADGLAMLNSCSISQQQKRFRNADVAMEFVKE